MHEPKTWPEQAQLAAEGRWEELDKLQDLLRGGRED
jgi:large subunit ribosomal protein L17